MEVELKVREAPHYVHTGTVLDNNGKFWAATNTKEDAEKIVTSISLMDKLIKQYAND